MRFYKNSHNDEEHQNALEQFQQGSAEAFHILYKRYHQGVYRFCLKMMGNEAAGKDAFQETFMRMYEHRRDFRGTNFPGWLFTIARHTCLNLIRSRKTFDSLNEECHEALSSTNKLDESDVIMRNSIDKAISQLPFELREALLLREYEEYSYQEIADIIGIDISLAKVRVHRARLILRKILSPIVQERHEA